MGMWIRFIPIIPISLLAEIQLHNFSDFFKQINGFVDSCQAGRWKVRFYLFENILYAWMPFAFCKDFQYSKSLGGYAEIKIL